MTNENDPNVLTFMEALLRVQQKLKAIKKDSTNPYFNSTYASLEGVLSASKEALNGEGIFIIQLPGKDDHGHYVETKLVHTKGQSISGHVYIVEPADMQKLGASITYARRFGLLSMLAMEAEDDDGESLRAPEKSKDIDKKQDPQTTRPANAYPKMKYDKRYEGKGFNEVGIEILKSQKEFWDKKLNGEEAKGELKTYLETLRKYLANVVRPELNEEDLPF